MALNNEQFCSVEVEESRFPPHKPVETFVIGQLIFLLLFKTLLRIKGEMIELQYQSWL